MVKKNNFPPIKIPQNFNFLFIFPGIVSITIGKNMIHQQYEINFLQSNNYILNENFTLVPKNEKTIRTEGCVVDER